MRNFACSIVAILSFVACADASMRGKVASKAEKGADAIATTQSTSGNDDEGKLGEGELSDGSGSHQCIKEVPVRYDDGGLGAGYASVLAPDGGAQSRISCDSIALSAGSNGDCSAVITGVKALVSGTATLQPGDVLTGTLNGKALKFENGKAKIDPIAAGSFDLRLKIATNSGAIAHCATLFTVKIQN